jgi:hypothetical protein
MTSFVVLHNDGAPVRFSERTEFIRDHFSILALAFPFFWLLWHRLWFAAIIFICALTALALIAGEHSFALVPLNILAGLFVALEGTAWHIGALIRKGYRQVGVIDAASREEAELKFALRQSSKDETPLVYKSTRPYEAPKSAQDANDLIFGLSGNK